VVVESVLSWDFCTCIQITLLAGTVKHLSVTGTVAMDGFWEGSMPMTSFALASCCLAVPETAGGGSLPGSGEQGMAVGPCDFDMGGITSPCRDEGPYEGHPFRSC